LMALIGKTAQLISLLIKAGLRGDGTLKHILGNALHTAEEVRDAGSDVRSIPSVPIDVLDGGSGADLKLHVFTGVPASISPLEAYAIAVMTKSCSVRRAFEFGTYKGVSTTQIALNLAESGRLWTLDLPDHTAKIPVLNITKGSEREIAFEFGKGSLVPADLLARVEFIRQDSALFDTAPFVDSMDLVFVDGAHSAEYVRNDSEKGWAMLRTGGIIVWHDCVPSHPDVVRFIKASTWSPRRIEGTSLAFAVKEQSPI